MRGLLSRVLSRFPHLKAGLRYLRDRICPSRTVSGGYVPLREEQAETEGQRLRNAWWNEALPARQRELVDRQLKAFRNGEAVDVFDVMVRALRDLPATGARRTLLEIGCSSGFYAEVLEIAGLNIAYSGCDYSEPFIALARERYPDLDFRQEDATMLAYPDEAFDIVVSGCCLLHIPEYRTAVAETARVAREYAIFHRTPVVLGQPDRYFRKLAYGVETVEIHFNEPEFRDLLTRTGLKVIAVHTLSENVSDGIGSAMRTYVCEKVRG